MEIIILLHNEIYKLRVKWKEDLNGYDWQSELELNNILYEALFHYHIFV